VEQNVHEDKQSVECASTVYTGRCWYSIKTAEVTYSLSVNLGCCLHEAIRRDGSRGLAASLMRRQATAYSSWEVVILMSASDAAKQCL